MKQFWVYKDGKLVFMNLMEYSFVRLERHGIDPAMFEIVKKGDEFFWYEVDGYKTRLIYEFLREKKA